MRRRWLLAPIVTIATWAFLIEPRRLVVHEETLALASSFRGLRVAAMSDLHVGGPHMGAARLRQVVDEANAQHADVIVLLGDFVTHAGAQSERELTMLDALRGLHAQEGVYAVLGNHDHWFGAERVRAKLESVGVRVLDGRAAKIEHLGQRVWLLGIPDEYTQHPHPPRILEEAKIPAGDPIVALTHDPDIFPRVPSRIALTLAGHTHGGQVRLPLVGAPVVPSRYGERYSRGHVVEGEHDLFVTTGVGTSILPLRFGVPPEVAVLTLR